jgi:hypothetical protein
VARRAPTMPRIVVSTKPEGRVGPDVINLAIIPATKPVKMVHRKLTGVASGSLSASLYAGLSLHSECS